MQGYTVAGKTGTANKIENGQYVDKYVASFVGMAPAGQPRLIVAVMIDEPTRGSYYGGAVAAPVFNEVTAGAPSFDRRASGCGRFWCSAGHFGTRPEK